MKLFTFILLFALLASSTIAQNLQSETVEKIDSIISYYGSKYEIPGISAGIIDLQDTTIISTYGIASVQTAKEVNANTLFRIGSCTKTFAAIAIMQLVERKKIALDQAVIDILPELSFRKPADFRKITIHDLLTHTSGLKEQISNGMFADATPSDCIVSEPIQDTLFISPSYHWAYSNYGYGLIGCIVENISGISFDEYVTKNILEPIGMNSTGFYSKEKDNPLLSNGYLDNGDKYIENPSREPAAGDMVSCAKDMSLFVEMLLNKGSLNGQMILTEESFDMMTTNRIKNLTLGTGMEFGYGFFVNDYGTISDSIIGKIIGHGGNTKVFHSMFYIFPKIGVGAFVMTNSENGRRAANLITTKLLDFHLENNKQVDVSSRKQESIEALEKLYSPTTNIDFTGFYDLGNGLMKAKKKGKHRLKLKTYFKSPNFTLIPMQNGYYMPKIYLFRFIPVKLKDNRIFFEQHGSEIIMNQIAVGSKECEYMGEKVRPDQAVADEWKKRAGNYEVVNLSKGHWGFFPKSIYFKKGIIHLEEVLLEGEEEYKKDITFEPISKSFAKCNKIGRGGGAFIEVLPNGNLYYSGFELKKVE